ncbi:hypothetical protein [Serratia fonticola]|uniref:hypothetical protein n=1 Tax=Serratia fonticola TaxID=47917 RepID=UPI00093BD2E7|nr:hypothetical protein [Serratia fonticola]OKP29397.1 hypothetical protein BSQ40_09245 [Serratia fonticola]
MWTAMAEKVPDQSGWILVSTNLGVGFAFYNQSLNEIQRLSLAGNRQSTGTKILHWAHMPEGPEGDYDPHAGGFQRQVPI